MTWIVTHYLVAWKYVATNGTTSYLTSNYGYVLIISVQHCWWCLAKKLRIWPCNIRPRSKTPAFKTWLAESLAVFMDHVFRVLFPFMVMMTYSVIWYIKYKIDQIFLVQAGRAQSYGYPLILSIILGNCWTNFYSYLDEFLNQLFQVVLCRNLTYKYTLLGSSLPTSTSAIVPCSKSFLKLLPALSPKYFLHAFNSDKPGWFY